MRNGSAIKSWNRIEVQRPLPMKLGICLSGKLLWHASEVIEHRELLRK